MEDDTPEPLAIAAWRVAQVVFFAAYGFAAMATTESGNLTGIIFLVYSLVLSIQFGFLQRLLVAKTILIALAYVWRFVEAAYLCEPDARTPEPGAAPLAMLLPAWLLVAACVYFGFDTSYTVEAARRAAPLLLGAAHGVLRR